MAELANTTPHDVPTHLTLILDLSPKQWHLSSLESNEFPLSLEAFLSQVLTFINAHLAGRHDNTVTVFGAFPGTRLVHYAYIIPSEAWFDAEFLLYSTMLCTSEDAQSSSIGRDANVYHPFRTVDAAVADRIRDHLASTTEDARLPIGLVGTITKALCHINKVLNPSSMAAAGESKVPASDPRILILSVSPDISASYIPIMNAIFAAQKLKVKIDVCKVYGEDTVFLQQAAHLTGGSYMSPPRRDALLQYLVMCFLAPGTVRNTLAFPTQERVDLRAACFCHKDIVDIGYVCSVCLSIFCAPKPVCTTCRTKFPIKTLMRYKDEASKGSVSNGRGRNSGSSTPVPSR